MLKRRLNGKVLVSLFVLLMTVCISAFAGLRDESWSVNPSDFRYDMSLYFRMENKDFEDLSSFEIGAFVDDECRGLAEKLELTQGESCLYMRIRSNQAEGEKISFYMKDKTTGQIVLVKGEDGSELTFKADSRIGLPSDPMVMSPFYVAVFKIDGEVYKTFEVGYGDPIEAPEVPEKEGYTFNGWGDVPATMPPYDIEMHSSYSVNMYTLTFKVGEDEVYSGQVAYGSSIIVPDAPAKEGYTFNGWGIVPETMPASDLLFVGNYEADSYKVVYKVDGEVVYVANFVYGDTIDAYEEVPDKVGYTFSGWTDIPETMPARDVEVNGSYVINHYTIEFRILGEVLVSQELAYGEEIIVPEAPGKEGYTFSGWGDVPDAMPAGDLVFEGAYSVNTYSVIFRIDQEVFQTVQLEYGAAIVAPEAPEMEGHTFSGWGDVPAVMPAYDLVFVGTYDDIYYTITFRIGDEIIKMADLAYGSEILLPEVPEKDGHTFSGWGDVPATMPASNMDIVGSYSVNSYIVTFRIDDEVIYTGELSYGAELVAPEAPGKDGYSFSGWGIVPSTMPASDLQISGTYVVNTYTLSFLIDGEVYYTTQIPYGSEITVPEPPLKEGHSLAGWNDVPATMPSYDLNVDATFSVNSYMLKFSVGDEVVFSGEIPYGAEIIAPEVAVKEGYTFSGWGMVPTTMPASDLEITGMYDVNIYNLTFIVDGELFYSTTLAYGSEIQAPVVPDMEGSAFSGWGEIPVTMPANDLVIYGTYSLSYYTLIFKIGEEVLLSGEMSYGAHIEVPVAPEREGYSFSGWGDVPSVMPNRNLEFIGSYEPKTYNLKFMIGDEVISESKVEYGSEIIVPDAPVKEGHSFIGWGVLPAVMPAQDLVFSGSYEVNSYAVVFRIAEDLFYSAQIPFGSTIAVPEVPEREGYTFSGWGEVPELMPSKDLEFTGDYNVNIYSVIFKIGEEVVSKTELAYGSEIIIPDVPDKEGYSFSGWGVVPPTMPASDLEFVGSYDVNSYSLIFKINDEVVSTSQVAYGSEIVIPQAPENEGYTFIGWDGVPSFMPARDLEFNGVYEVNHYRLVVYLNDEVYIDEEVAYGAEVVIPEPNVEKGMKFEGWQEDIPATMPAHDVEIHGSVVEDGQSVVNAVLTDDDITVLTIDGVVLYKNVKASDITDRLIPGIYIINGKKIVVR